VNFLARGASVSLASAVEQYNSGGKKVGLGGALSVDLSQSPQRLRVGPWLQTIARSTVHCSVSKMHLYTPSEVDFAMGWPSIVDEHNKTFASRLKLGEALAGTSFAVRRSFSGNGMMLPQVMAWTLYVMSHCARRAYFEKLMLPLSSATFEPEHDASEDKDLDQLGLPVVRCVS
jgi:hypothetical protein